MTASTLVPPMPGRAGELLVLGTDTGGVEMWADRQGSLQHSDLLQRPNAPALGETTALCALWPHHLPLGMVRVKWVERRVHLVWWRRGSRE